MPLETNDPTPEEIRQRFLEIQATWSPSEAKRRAGFDATQERAGHYTSQTWGMSISEDGIEVVTPSKFKWQPPNDYATTLRFRRPL